MSEVNGLHHLTAIAGDAQRNYDFYAGVLGLRLVKHTVNFDDPGSLHLYYGDAVGSPGTLLTFFPWPNGAAGLRGVHQAGTFTLRIPREALGFWLERLIEKGVAYRGPSLVTLPSAGASATSTTRGTAQSLEFKDPDGLDIRLVAAAADPGSRASFVSGAPEARPHATVPAEYAVRGIHDVQLWVHKAQPTVTTLEALGYHVVDVTGNVTSLATANGGGQIAVRETGQFLPGREGVGTVHHVALSVADDGLERLAAALVARGLETTAVRDRKYFRSVYCREPGGVLLELATAGPGFAVDEPVESLGEALTLPPQYEPLRSRLELTLPRLVRSGD